MVESSINELLFEIHGNDYSWLGYLNLNHISLLEQLYFIYLWFMDDEFEKNNNAIALVCDDSDTFTHIQYI